MATIIILIVLNWNVYDYFDNDGYCNANDLSIEQHK